MSILYHSTKYELDWFTNNRVLLSDRNITSLISKILEAINVNCLEDRDMSIFYLSTKYRLDRFTNNGLLLSDRNSTSLSSIIVKAIIANFTENCELDR